MNIWDAVFGASKIVDKPGELLMLPILACLAGAKWGGVERENPPPF